MAAPPVTPVTADKALPKRADQQRNTTKVEPLPRPGRFGLKVSGGMLTLLIALGGAVLGSLGSQVVAFLTAERTSPAGTGSAATGLLSKAATAGERLFEIDQALQAGEFGTALLFAEEGQRLYPGDPRFAGKQKRAEDEIQNRFRYQTMQAAIARLNFAAAVALFDEIPADSAFKGKASQDLGKAREQYIAEQLRDGQTAVKLALCDEAKTCAQAVLTVDSDNTTARSLIAECEKSGTPP